MTAALDDDAAFPPVLVTVDTSPVDSDLSIEELGERIVGMSGRLAEAMCRWLLLVANFDAREAYDGFGLPSTARWLSHCCGIAHRTAVEHVRVARALAQFPALAQAMSAGRLSYSHVRAISRVPKDGEDTVVDDLIEIAETGTVGQLETVVRGMRSVEDAGAHEPPEEYLRQSWSSGSQRLLTARLDPEHGALVDSALARLAHAEDITQVEALERMAEITLAVLAAGHSSAASLRGEERAAIVVHLDVTQARDAAQETSSPGEHRADLGDHVDHVDHVDQSFAQARPRFPEGRIADGPGLPSSVVRRLLCDGRIRTVVRDGTGGLLNLGRSHRLASKKQFRALLYRDGGCAHPGCGSRRGLEAHHVKHWIDGGLTDLANLVLLCRRHHHSHHDGEFDIEIRADGLFVFVRADGRILEHHVVPSVYAASTGPIAADLDVAPAPNWRGDGRRLDREWAVAVLAERREQRRRAAAAAHPDTAEQSDAAAERMARSA